ncbi:MAG: rhomboid family intramembrane serine protease [Pseudoxanthomonas sp.]
MQASQARRPLELLRRFPCTAALLAAIWLVFAVELALHAPGDRAVLLRLGALPDHIPHGQYWRLLSHALLHANWLHIALNTLLLLIAGPPLERRLGSATCLVTALAGAVLGGLATLGMHHGDGSNTVGASGAFFALLGAALVAIHVRPPVRPGPVLVRRLWLALMVGLGYSFFPDVGMAAHLAGLAVGAGIAWAGVRRPSPRPA